MIEPCIFSSDGFESMFNIDNDKRKNVMQYLLNLDSQSKKYQEEYKNDTEKYIIERYDDISKYLEDKFKDTDKKIIDSKKLEHFCHYFLRKLVLVELDISQDDTPMVFEVINDRGEKLKPYEILKSKLIGALDKLDTQAICKIWEDSIHRMEGVDVDGFFSDYLKSKFIFTRNSKKEKSINNLYHRYIFENNDIAEVLKLRKTDLEYKENIKNFIKRDIDYYSKLYVKISKSENEFLRYCEKIHEIDGQYRLIMAACKIDDKDEDKKIEIIAKQYDRLFMLLKLNGVYDSNAFQEITYNLQKELKKANIDEYKEIFNNKLEEAIKEKRKVERLDSILSLNNFSNLGYDNLTAKFLRYLFARVEKYICDNINKKPQPDVLDISTKNGRMAGGYHIEHILAHNDTNKSYFESEEEFETQRNKLGGLLLLKGKPNILSGNEEYQDKLKTYSNSFLVWGHTLRNEWYHNNKEFKEFNESLKTKFEPYEKFDKTALIERTKLLYELVKEIWNVK